MKNNGASIICDVCQNRVNTEDAVPYIDDHTKVYICFECWQNFDPRSLEEEYDNVET